MLKNTQILEGSRAIALTVNNIGPDVISAYPITPQTHIVEDLAKLKADGKATYEYVRAESEFAAASIVEGASATGSRVYTATSSQGILLMTEVLFNIAGMRLPIIVTCANRGVSAPITIWNDHQDAMTIRDSGWMLFFAENHQEAVGQHVMAYKIAEKLKLPAMVNIDGFVLTHSYEPVEIPDKALIKKYLPAFKPKADEFLNTKNPVSFGAFATPAHYLEIRQKLHNDLEGALKVIKEEYEKYTKLFKIKPEPHTSIDNGLIQYYGSRKAKTVLIALGSVAGTVKDVVDQSKNKSIFSNGEIGLLKIKTLRPFPEKEILKALTNAKHVAVLDKAISLGHSGPVAMDLKASANGNLKAKIQSFIVGLGGRDITKEMINKIIKNVKEKNNETKFIG